MAAIFLLALHPLFLRNGISPPLKKVTFLLSVFAGLALAACNRSPKVEQSNAALILSTATLKADQPDPLMTSIGAWDFACPVLLAHGKNPHHISPFSPRDLGGKLIWVAGAEFNTAPGANTYWSACIEYTPSENLLSVYDSSFLWTSEHLPPWWPTPGKVDHPKPDFAWNVAQ
jgi:hypothetical protein